VIAVLVPVLNRPERVRPLAESCAAASTHVSRLVFIVSMDDAEEMSAVRHAVLAMPEFVEAVIATFPVEGGDYARKINHGIRHTTEPWVFQAGDDVHFHPGWDTEALAIAMRSDAGCVIGTNDLGNPVVKSGMHSTHSLIRRTYIEELGTIDEPGKALHEGYWHCWVDNELIETAKSRRAYFAARLSVVEHLHHIWPVKAGSRERKGRDDATYRRGQERYHEDHRLFIERRPLWRGRRR